MTRRTLLALALAAALAAPLAAPVAPRLAPPAAAQDSLEAAKRRELDEINRRARESRQRAQQLKGRESQELVKLRRTERDLNATRRRLRALQNRQRALDQQLEVTRASLERSILSLEQQRQRLARRLRTLYKQGAGRELEFLLSTQSFAQLLQRWDFLVMVAESDRLMLDDLRGRKEQVEADKQRLELNLGELRRNEQRTGAQQRRLDQLRELRASTVRNIQTQRQAYEAAAAELEKTARSIRNLLARLERQRREEAERARAQGRAPQPYSGDFAKGQGQLDWPVRGNVVGRFGNEVHPRWGTVTPNNGVDIEVPVGTPVRAVARGRVDFTSDDYGTYGQMVLINHGDGFYTMYAHLSSIGVAVGQEIEAGAVIGRSGDTGSLKGPILHFEVRKGGSPLDPMDWLQ
uniref:Peptidase M23 domain-containing protein n=1 Tax=Eiseniibacteriota bacterium TaxID=2212470 RepID=A0A832MK49_UNCEI